MSITIGENWASEPGGSVDVPLSVWLAVCDGSTSNICEISLLIIVVMMVSCQYTLVLFSVLQLFGSSVERLAFITL